MLPPITLGQEQYLPLILINYLFSLLFGKSSTYPKLLLINYFIYNLFIQHWGKKSTCPKCLIHAYLTMFTTNNFGARVVLALNKPIFMRNLVFLHITCLNSLIFNYYFSFDYYSSAQLWRKSNTYHKLLSLNYFTLYIYS